MNDDNMMKQLQVEVALGLQLVGERQIRVWIELCDLQLGNAVSERGRVRVQNFLDNWLSGIDFGLLSQQVLSGKWASDLEFLLRIRKSKPPTALFSTTLTAVQFGCEKVIKFHLLDMVKKEYGYGFDCDVYFDCDDFEVAYGKQRPHCVLALTAAVDALHHRLEWVGNS